MSPERAAYVNSLDYLDAGEAADLLRISRKQIYRLVKAQRLPVTILGRKQVFTRAALDAFMQHGGLISPTPMANAAKEVLRHQSN